MIRDVEGKGLLQADDGTEVALGPGVGELLQSGVGAGHIGGVVLAVVQLDDLARVIGLQGTGVVRGVGEDVLGHLCSSE
jgi:hypothetical protein